MLKPFKTVMGSNCLLECKWNHWNNGRSSPISTRAQFRCDASARNVFKPSKNLRIPNYKTHRMDMTSKVGGTANPVKHGIKYQQLPQPNEGLREATGVRVKIVEGDLNIYSAYILPGDDLPAKQLKEVLQMKTLTILAGNFNAKDENWNKKTTSIRGKRLNKLLKIS